MPESAQSEELTYYYGTLFRGFATGAKKDTAIYDSCTAEEGTATIKLNSPFAGFISAMSLPAFSMQSPTEHEKSQDDGADDPRTPAYPTKTPVGTGQFKFGPWEPHDRTQTTTNHTT